MYVFPGGRVDASDADPAAWLDDLTLHEAAVRLDLMDAAPPAIAYFVAGFREAFEETGILLGSLVNGSPPPTAADDPAVDLVRAELMDGRIGFAEALARMECRIKGTAVEYIAHWITPLRQPRRFDTRFFAARVEGSSTPIVDPREMTDARWVTPAQALAAHALGNLPMILPTVHTLERLGAFGSAAETLEALARETVVTIMPGG